MGGTHPRLHVRVVHTITRGVDVHAADHGTGGIEDGVGEPRPSGEVLRVPLEVGAIVVEGHLAWPRAVGSIPGRGEDVRDARAPGVVIPLVVLRAEWLQAKAVGVEPAGRLEPVGDEQSARRLPGRAAEAAWRRPAPDAAAA